MLTQTLGPFNFHIYIWETQATAWTNDKRPFHSSLLWLPCSLHQHAHGQKEACSPSGAELGFPCTHQPLRVARMLPVSTREGLLGAVVLEDRMAHAAQPWTLTALRSAQESALP